MKALRTFLAACLTLGFVLSSALSHAHQGPEEAASAPVHHHATMHGAAHGHGAAHIHGESDAEPSQSADTPHCCTMGACGVLESAAPLLSHDRVALTFAPVDPAPAGSFESVPEAPPPRRID